jgi:hypothetical protein
MMMADDRTKTGVQDRARISLTEDYEVRDWTDALGVDENTLRNAVQAVGDRADDVRAYLKNR